MELDIAAGRALFQATSLYGSLAPDPSGPLPDGVPPARTGERTRRAIRVVYPTPYGR